MYTHKYMYMLIIYTHNMHIIYFLILSGRKRIRNIKCIHIHTYIYFTRWYYVPRLIISDFHMFWGKSPSLLNI